MNNFYPLDDFSLSLLSSVPKKTKFLLSNAGLDISGPIVFENIKTTAFQNNGGVIEFTKLGITITWEGNDDSPSTIYSNREQFQDIKNNLDDFVEFEKEIYLEIEKIAEEHDAAN